MFKKSQHTIWTFVIVTLMTTGCKKFITVDPPTDRLVSATVFADNAAATSAMVGVYSRMMQNDYGFANSGITLFAGLAADEFTNYSANPMQNEFFTNNLSPANTTINDLWARSFNTIYACNAIIDGLEKSGLVADSLKKQLTGEAKFVRAFCHFYLLNLYGNIPYITATDYSANSMVPARPASEVYQLIITDLQEAKNLLAGDYSFSGGEKVRPCKWAAASLLARTYLYTGQWELAIDEADAVINNGGYALEADLNNVFLLNSNEAIWQLMPVRPNRNTNEGLIFILTNSPAVLQPGVSLSPALLESFETGDNRRRDWVDSITVSSNVFYFPYKYKVRNDPELYEYYTVLRLSEQYLIRAEASIRNDEINQGIDDLNLLRSRSRGINPGDLPDIDPGLSTSVALLAVEHERQTELFAEWGHRWFDLNRTNRTGEILPITKPGDWQATDRIFPIPQDQINRDPNMLQNEGY